VLGPAFYSYRRLTAAVDPYLRAMSRRLALFAVAAAALAAAGVFALVAVAVALGQALGAVAASFILALRLGRVGAVILVLLRRPAVVAPAAAVPPAGAAGLGSILAATLFREVLGPRPGLRLVGPVLAAVGAGLLVARLQSRRRPPPL
jgi:hypothetical protein